MVKNVCGERVSGRGQCSSRSCLPQLLKHAYISHLMLLGTGTQGPHWVRQTTYNMLCGGLLDVHSYEWLMWLVNATALLNRVVVGSKLHWGAKNQHQPPTCSSGSNSPKVLPDGSSDTDTTHKPLKWHATNQRTQARTRTTTPFCVPRHANLSFEQETLS